MHKSCTLFLSRGAQWRVKPSAIVIIGGSKQQLKCCFWLSLQEPERRRSLSLPELSSSRASLTSTAVATPERTEPKDKVRVYIIFFLRAPFLC